MAYGDVMDIAAPIEFYDALHAEIGRRGGGDGLLVHIGRPTPDGFQVLEIWESKEQWDRFNSEVVGPALAELSGGQPPPSEPMVVEFEPRGLIVPSAAVAV